MTPRDSRDGPGAALSETVATVSLSIVPGPSRLSGQVLVRPCDSTHAAAWVSMLLPSPDY